jgi:polysaccharide pyruvyl transferase WcaK-like protein
MKDRFDNICIWGTSVKKVGDEAQFASVLSFLKQYNPRIEVTVLSRLSGKVTTLLQQVGVNGGCIKLFDIASVYRRLKKADVLVIIGGPFFEHWYQMFSVFTLFLLARLTHTKIVTFGTTLFPLHTPAGKLLYRYIYSRLSIISSRDEKAQDVLNAIGVNKTVQPLVDPRYILQVADRDHIAAILRDEGINPEKHYIAITTRNLHDEMPEWVKAHHDYSTEIAKQSYASLANLFRELAADYQLVIVPMHPTLEEDHEVASRLFANCDKNCNVLKKRYTPFEIIGIFRQSQFSIQSRLGSTVFSVVAGTPFLAISYEPRMLDMMAANGMDEYCVDWRDIRIDEVMKQIQKLSDNTDAIKRNFDNMKKEKQTLFLSQAEKILADPALHDNQPVSLR